MCVCVCVYERERVRKLLWSYGTWAIGWLLRRIRSGQSVRYFRGWVNRTCWWISKSLRFFGHWFYSVISSEPLEVFSFFWSRVSMISHALGLRLTAQDQSQELWLFLSKGWGLWEALCFYSKWVLRGGRAFIFSLYNILIHERAFALYNLQIIIRSSV